MSPIKQQILDHKKQIENRLVVLRSATESEEKLKENLARLQDELTQLSKQRNELGAIIQEMQETSGFQAEQLVSLVD